MFVADGRAVSQHLVYARIAGREPTKAEITKKTKALARKAAVPTCASTSGCSKACVADGKYCRAHTCQGCGSSKPSSDEACEDCVLANMRAEESEESSESEDAFAASDSEDSAYGMASDASSYGGFSTDSASTSSDDSD